MSEGAAIQRDQGGANPIVKAAVAVRRQTRLMSMLAWTTGVVSTSFLVQPFTREAARVDMVDRYKMRWVRGAVRIVGLDVHLAGGEVRPSERGRLVVANHRSPLDALAIMFHFGGYFVANHRTKNAPIIGWGARRIGTIFVDRESRRSGANALRAMRTMLEEKRTVVVFPEGTTHGDDEVREFKAGALLAARGIDVDVVPVGLAYTSGHEFGSGSLGAHVRTFLDRSRTSVWMSVGEPRRVTAKEKPDATFAEALRADVQALVHQARRAGPSVAAPAEPR